MKVLDTLIVGHDRDGGLTMPELRAFMAKFGDMDVVLLRNEKFSDHESVWFDVVDTRSLSDAPVLKRQMEELFARYSDSRNGLRFGSKHFRRADSAQAVREEFEEFVRSMGYWIERDKPNWVAHTLERNRADDKGGFFSVGGQIQIVYTPECWLDEN